MLGIEVDVFSDAIGAEIRGVDLSRELDRDNHRGHPHLRYLRFFKKGG